MLFQDYLPNSDVGIGTSDLPQPITFSDMRNTGRLWLPWWLHLFVSFAYRVPRTVQEMVQMHKLGSSTPILVALIFDYASQGYKKILATA